MNWSLKKAGPVPEELAISHVHPESCNLVPLAQVPEPMTSGSGPGSICWHLAISAHCRLGLLAMLPDSWEGRGLAWHSFLTLVFPSLLGFTGRKTKCQHNRFVSLFLLVTHFFFYLENRAVVTGWSWLWHRIASSMPWCMAKGLFQ